MDFWYFLDLWVLKSYGRFEEDESVLYSFTRSSGDFTLLKLGRTNSTVLSLTVGGEPTVVSTIGGELMVVSTVSGESMVVVDGRLSLSLSLKLN